MVKTKLLILICTVTIFPCCEDLIVKSANSNQNLEDFEAAWKRVKTVYPYLELKEINWDSMYMVYLPRAENARGDEIFTVLLDLLGELKDMHVHVKTDGGRMIQTYHAPRWLKDKYAYDPLIVRNYFEKELIITGEGSIEYEIMGGNIGYIYLGTFDEDYIINFFPEALDYVKNTEALILDIRHNNGGSYQNLVAAVSRFITSPLEKPGYYLLGEPIPLPPFEPQGPFQYTHSVVLLINGVCYSTGDIFPEVMKQISTVTVIGDKIFVGTTDWRGYDGLPLEWIGVAPDIRVEQTTEAIAKGRDKQLEYAINMLK
jgi:hypothetical protein